jgi:YHS domain-containing protein
MNWLAQNWIWIALALGALLFFARRGQHSFGRSHGGTGGHGHGSHQAPRGASGMERSDAAIDPVSGVPLATQHAITTYYRGRVYFFENEENRRRFEATPENFALDQGRDASTSSPQRSHRRHGC